MNKRTRYILASAFLVSVVLANWFVAHVGTQQFPGGPHVLPVWPGIDAPSAVYIVGVTLVLRDLVQRSAGKPATFVLILLGAGLSALFAPSLALASGVAFLISETVDLIVFSLTERFGLSAAVLASNAVSLVVDSIAFLTIAFGSLAYLDGQIIGKAWATLAALIILIALRGRQTAVTA